jgi:hypothetical protein
MALASIPNALARNTTYTSVTITEVNPARHYAVGIDTRGGTYQMSMFWNGPTTVVPAVNERWIIQRIDNNWFLFARTETGEDSIPFPSLLPGDKRIEAKESLYLQGRDIVINGIIWSPPRFTIANEIPTGDLDGVNTTFKTRYFYYDETLRVYFNGLRILPTELPFDATEGVGREFEMPSAPGISDTIICDYETHADSRSD